MPLIKERVSKKATLIAAMVWCILLLVNAWIFLHRSEGYNYRRLATYDELYVPSEKQHIKKLYFKSDSAIIEMANPMNAQAWRFVRDDSIVAQALVNGHRLAIPLKKGIHTYHFVASGINQPAFECALDFVCEPNGGPGHCRNEWL
ncbi:MAG TPA: hypothetical protein VLL95_02190, partial [Phnomibacter sp.]|nr:hypothetical protein [Phnomibacter sp.]